MAVTLDDVRHIAALARVAISQEREPALVAELNAILGHMEVLTKVDTSSPLDAPEGGAGMILRPDVGPPDALFRTVEEIAPMMRANFLLVPRLATHEAAAES